MKSTIAGRRNLVLVKAYSSNSILAKKSTIAQPTSELSVLGRLGLIGATGATGATGNLGSHVKI
jgi:hypothetical protein